MQLTALALWLNTAFAGFDEAVATAIHQLYVAAGWFFTPFLSFISLLGKGGIFLACALPSLVGKLNGIAEGGIGESHG